MGSPKPQVLRGGLLREHLTAMDKAVGTFVHEKSEGLDEYLTKMGVPWMVRKVLANTSPTIEIVREGDQWNMTFKESLKTNKIIFKIGEEFQENSPIDQTPQQCVATIEDNSLLVITNKTQQTSRTFVFSDEGMTMTMASATKYAKAKRIFKRKA